MAGRSAGPSPRLLGEWRLWFQASVLPVHCLSLYQFPRSLPKEGIKLPVFYARKLRPGARRGELQEPGGEGRSAWVGLGPKSSVWLGSVPRSTGTS